MRNAVTFEGLEARKLLSAVASTASKVNVIGPTSGVTAQVASPMVASINVTSHNSNKMLADLDGDIGLTISGTADGGIDESTLTRTAVKLYNETTHAYVQLNRVSTSGGGDIIVVAPLADLTANTTYQVEVNQSYVSSGSLVRDVAHNAFAAYSGRFTTGTYSTPYNQQIAFTATQVAGDGRTDTAHTSPAFLATAIGPDGKLYASTTDGHIYRYTINADGTLGSSPQIIDTVITANGANRIITGIAFDPGSTADHLVLWVSHNQYRFGNDPNGSDDVQKYADNYTGKISILSGPDLATYTDAIINIPRSVKDHMNNQIVFDHSGKSFYFAIAAMNASGNADPVWGYRVENLYSGSILRVTLGGANGINTWISAKGPVNLKIDNDTLGNGASSVPNPNAVTHYNIYKGSNPVRFYADGIRNDFDLVSMSNGHLFAAINGSSAGGTAPDVPASTSDIASNRRLDYETKGAYSNALNVSGISPVQQIEEDFLIDVKEGAYYGHPNPARGEYILDGGNPTSGADPYEFRQYAERTQPDRNYTLPVYDFGKDYSPDGLLQYVAPSSGVDSALDGYLLVDRYSSGSDILGIKPNADGSVSSSGVLNRVSGFEGLTAPLDMVEDTTTGNIYVTELINEVSQGAIVLLKPTVASGGGTTSGGTPTLNKTKQGFYVTPGNSTGVTQTVTLTNTGTGSITVDRSATKISSRLYRKNFGITNLPADDLVLAAGESYTFNVKGVLAAGQTAPAGVSPTPNTELAIRVLNTAGGNVYATVNLRAFDATKLSTQSFTPQSLAGPAVHSRVFSGVSIGSAISQLDSTQDDLF